MTSLLPAPRKESKPVPKWQPKLEDMCVREIKAGRDPRKLAAKLAKGDKTIRRRWRDRIEQLLFKDVAVARRVAAEAHLELNKGMVPGLKAMNGRMRRTGRAPEVKLALEATGIHNPKVSHEHSGDININVTGVPRPTAVDNEATIEGTATEVDS